MNRYALSLADKAKTDNPVKLEKSGGKSKPVLNRKGLARYKGPSRPSKRSAY